MQCPNCGASVNPNTRFCPYCAYDMSQAAQGAGLAPTQVFQSSACPNCGVSVAPGAQFCPNCAAPISTGSPYGGQPFQQPQNYPPAQNYPGGQNYPGAGYPRQGFHAQGYVPSFAPPPSNKLPIILGVVVLVLIGGAVAAYFLWFNKSETSTQQSSVVTNTSKPADKPADKPQDAAIGRPGEVIKQIIRTMERGDTQGFIDLLVEKERAALNLDVDTPQGNPKKIMTEKITEASGKMKGWGGIKTIDIKDEKINGDTASVNYLITYSNGLTEPGTMNLLKEKGQWRVKTSPRS